MSRAVFLCLLHMNKLKPALLLLGLLCIALFSNCKRNTQVSLADPYMKCLIKKRVGDSKFHISLPNNYIVKVSRGPDFDVYYFGPADTTDKTHFHGGFYLGNAGALFTMDEADSCKTSEVEGVLLSEKMNWEFNDCKSKFFIQGIVNIKNAKHFPRQIHAFGSAKSKDEAKNLLTVFSTLYSD